MNDYQWAEAGPVLVTGLAVGDFVDRIPSFNTRGKRGGRYVTRGARVESGVVGKRTIEEAGAGMSPPDAQWYVVEFSSGPKVIIPGWLEVTARTRTEETA